MLHRVIAGLLTACLVAAFAGVPAGAQSTGSVPKTKDKLRAFSIVPPGQEGDVTAQELAEDSFGIHYDDQLEMYASLIEDDDVTEGELSTYFHSMQFGTDTIEEEYSPLEGVTIYRDDFGIPHIYADTEANASWALGYVTAEDRLWESDVFRHAARGTLSNFIGPDYLSDDIVARRDGYTEAEVQEMLDSFDERFGATGEKIQTGLQAYAEGFNAFVDTLTLNPDQCPSEYAATGNPCPGNFPADWTATDTAFLAILQLRVFGETAGEELENAGLYAHLGTKLGTKLGKKVYKDLVFKNERRSPTTINPKQGKFAGQDLGSPKRASYVIPDDAVALAREVSRSSSNYKQTLANLGFRAPASNAILVSGQKSATGNPLQIGAPQVGYANPAFFLDVDVHAPGINFRGPAVPGASALIPLGRGVDYAWSLTTGYSDAVDTRVELLCDPGGGEATQDSNAYMFKGECVEMESRAESFLVKPSAASTGPPDMHAETFFRTIHGPVLARGSVDGQPVAFVKQRFFWKKELDSLPPFYRWNTKVTSVKDFKSAASQFTMSFNSFYADYKDIGYFHVGQYPQRPKGTHPSLPTWGTGKWEWKGRVPFKSHPQAINPDQGWAVNWNNKPAFGWDNLDGIKWGSIQRVQLLMDNMKKLFRNGKKARLSDLVDVIRDAATRDTRGVYLATRMLRKGNKAKGDGVGDARKMVQAWIKNGAHRLNLDRGPDMDDGATLALFDRWYDLMVHRIFDDELGPEGFELLRGLSAPVTDYAPGDGSAFWFDFSSYLDLLFRKSTRRGLARNYCDDLGTPQREGCKKQVAAALLDAIAVLTEEQGADMTAWTTPAENMTWFNVGAGAVAEIPWQNRGTHNHAVEVLGRR